MSYLRILYTLLFGVILSYLKIFNRLTALELLFTKYSKYWIKIIQQMQTMNMKLECREQFFKRIGSELNFQLKYLSLIFD